MPFGNFACLWRQQAMFWFFDWLTMLFIWFYSLIVVFGNTSFFIKVIPIFRDFVANIIPKEKHENVVLSCVVEIATRLLLFLTSHQPDFEKRIKGPIQNDSPCHLKFFQLFYFLVFFSVRRHPHSHCSPIWSRRGGPNSNISCLQSKPPKQGKTQKSGEIHEPWFLKIIFWPIFHGKIKWQQYIFLKKSTDIFYK